jgi:ABC-type antimicrobial peptide transport system permease subunit
MAYSNFTLAKVKEDFGLTVNETQNLFANIQTVQPSEILTVTLQE